MRTLSNAAVLTYNYVQHSLAETFANLFFLLGMSVALVKKINK